ncbi:MAG: hypothetical protein LQ347_003315 [Umbilicaria vellea]|nr:MAG: hypothetical protein LQ347_003315 [Umbilicaria vellea]
MRQSVPPSPVAYHPLMMSSAQYDDEPAIPGVDEANSFSIYDGLQYTDFSLSNTSLQVTGLGPHSKPNLVSSSPSQQLTQIPSVTTVYSATPYSSFSLKSFWFGCFVMTAQGEASSTEGCTLQVTSYLSSSSSPYAMTNFDFAPSVSNLLSSPMIQAVLPTSGFDKVQKVTFQQSPAATVGFGIDNMEYFLNW